MTPLTKTEMERREQVVARHIDTSQMSESRRNALQILTVLGFEVRRHKRGNSKIYVISYEHKGVTTTWDINHKQLGWQSVLSVIQSEGFNFSDELNQHMSDSFLSFMKSKGYLS